MKKLVVMFTTLLSLLAPACAVTSERAEQSEKEAVTVNPNAVLYNTPGVQVGPDGGVLGTQENPFTIVQDIIFAIPAHADAWAINSGEYGTFHKPETLEGILQYKWIRCGMPHAGC